jgi:hypothetical protein
MSSQREDDLDYGFGTAMQDTFLAGDQGDSKEKSSLRMFDDEGLPILSPYVFGTYLLFQYL